MFLLCPERKEKGMKAIRLKTEYLYEPCGLGIKKPRLLWNCTGGSVQTAYEISCSVNGTVYTSGKVQSSDMFHDFRETELQSRDSVIWKVRLWDENGRDGGWSETASFEMGLLEEKDWKAVWISGDYKAKKKNHYPIDCFRKTFECHDMVKARAYVAACGIYDIRINGKRITDTVLNSGATDFRKRVQAQTYDVTPCLNDGENVIEAELAGGWFKSYVLSSGAALKNNYNPKLIFQLEMESSNGEKQEVLSNSTWAWCNNGPVRFAENKAGEVIDASMTADYSGNARETTHAVARIPSDNVSMKRHEVFVPELIVTKQGKRVLDFGQNIAGFLRFDINGHKGDRMTCLFGELMENGEFTQRNIDPDKSHAAPFQKLEYIFREGANHYETRFAIFGFQYVLVDTDLEIDPEDFRAIAVYSDLENTLKFSCDNELLNRFAECTRWSAKNNSADLPTDCPTRERVGWTGDAQIFCNTASYLFDYAAFGRKYIRDIIDSQHVNGSYTQSAPRCSMAKFMDILDASAGWADAGILIPYRLWKKYGDERFIRESYSSMKRYGEFLIRKCGRKRLFDRRPDISRDAQKYVVATGLSYGEWLEPTDLVPFDVKDVGKPHIEENTAYVAYSLRLLSEMAEHLGYGKDAERFRKYEKGCTEAYRELVRLPQHSLDTDRQAKLVRPLYMGLLDEETEQKAEQRLIQALEHYGWRVGTGFLSTPFLLPVLEKINAEYAYKLLENTRIPGWLAMPANGATTIWEKWEGNTEENPESLDHYSKGAVLEWVFSGMCGIRVVGNNRFHIEPVWGGKIREASLKYLSVYGKVESSWKRVNGDVICSFVIPANTVAEVVLNRETHILQAGSYSFTVKDN